MFEAEPELRLFELMRWTYLGGLYRNHQLSSDLVYTAARIACFDRTPTSSLRAASADRELQKLFRDVMQKRHLYDLLRVNNIGLISADKEDDLQLQDAADIGKSMVTIHQARGKFVFEDVLVLSEIRANMRKRSSLKGANNRYMRQLVFVSAYQSLEYLTFIAPTQKALLRPQELLAILRERIRADVLRTYFSRVECIARVVWPELAAHIQGVWQGLQPLAIEDLGFNPLTDAKRNYLIGHGEKQIKLKSRTDSSRSFCEAGGS